ncbi:ribokinase [Agromyces protaetiae]|uniref:Ribokinase n=1 Tax=Agromyces protaetiae TaxID=2509455 RepID=A0A4P6FSA8_9MICO|nr:PfkB family carbohydrate kinase [Agromyces protaetiae]QAY73418.1 ribokinase [Agromyces protaetiae]
MSADPTVVCVGSATVDTIALVDVLPGRDERVVADELVVAGGGPAATAAVTLARLGVPVGFAGVVGDDDAGREVRAALEAEGVDTRWLRIDRDARTARSVVVVERASGARTIITSPSVRPTAADVPAAARWLHVDQNGYAAARAALAARASSTRPGHGQSLSVDDGNPIDGIDLAGVDLYAPTRAVLTARFGAANKQADHGQALRAARAAGARLVVATAGAEGADVLEEDGAVVHVPAVPVDAVSTLGAGDVFHGALLAAVVGGASLVDAATSAARVAAESTRALDGRSAVPFAADQTSTSRQ